MYICTTKYPSLTVYTVSQKKNYLNFIIFEENIGFEVVDGFVYNIYILSLKRKKKTKVKRCTSAPHLIITFIH